MVDFSKITSEKIQETRYKLEEIENIIEKTVCFTGHRPNKLGGYDMKNPIITQLKLKLEEVIEKLIVEEEITRFISGGALGVDQVAFKRVDVLKQKYPHIENILAVPFRDQSLAWPISSQRLYDKVLSRADHIIYIDELPEYQIKNDKPIGEYSAVKMQMRNNYMVDNSRIVVAVHDGTKGGTGNCVKYAQKSFKTIYTLNPLENFELHVKN